MSRLKTALKRMWANVWFRSLVELVVIILATVILMLILQSSKGGLQLIDQVKKLMGYPEGV